MRRGGVAAVAALALVAATGAFAGVLAAPPAGRYTCRIVTNDGYGGVLFVVDASHYRVAGKAGVYAADGKKNLTFRTGIFHGNFKARWFVPKGKRAELVFTSLKSGNVTHRCTWKAEK